MCVESKKEWQTERIYKWSVRCGFSSCLGIIVIGNLCVLVRNCSQSVQMIMLAGALKCACYSCAMLLNCMSPTSQGKVQNSSWPAHLANEWMYQSLLDSSLTPSWFASAYSTILNTMPWVGNIATQLPQALLGLLGRSQVDLHGVVVQLAGENHPIIFKDLFIPNQGTIMKYLRTNDIIC